jgi:glycerol-3-phosphate acyltransferase PlsY
VMAVVLGVIASYLVGAIPFGYLAGKVLKGIDIRDFGSGNLGATNVLRTLGTGPGIGVLLLDIGKGLFSVLLVADFACRYEAFLNPSIVKVLCGAAAIVGHDWPIFLRFRGGKGVATGLGVFLALKPLWALVGLFLFVIAVVLTKQVSVGSLVLATCLPASMLISGQPLPYCVLGLFWLLTVVYLHRENIRRLLHGTESRIGQKAHAPREKP